jgi:hypothetical protein
MLPLNMESLCCGVRVMVLAVPHGDKYAAQYAGRKDSTGNDPNPTPQENPLNELERRW